MFVLTRCGTRAVRKGAMCALMILMAGGFAGCADSDRGESVATRPVHGKVILADGTPLASGSVVFVPAPTSETARQAAGKIGSDGSYALKTANSGDGAAPGDYVIRIETSETGPVVPRGTRAKPKINPKYFDEDSSGLKYTVTAADNQHDVHLK